MWYKKADSEWGCSSHNRHNRCMVRTYNLRRRPSRRVPSSHQNRIVAEYGRRRWIKTSCLLNVTNDSRHFSSPKHLAIAADDAPKSGICCIFFYISDESSRMLNIFSYFRRNLWRQSIIFESRNVVRRTNRRRSLRLVIYHGGFFGARAP